MKLYEIQSQGREGQVFKYKDFGNLFRLGKNNEIEQKINDEWSKPDCYNEILKRMNEDSWEFVQTEDEKKDEDELSPYVVTVKAKDNNSDPVAIDVDLTQLEYEALLSFLRGWDDRRKANEEAAKKKCQVRTVVFDDDDYFATSIFSLLEKFF